MKSPGTRAQGRTGAEQRTANTAEPSARRRAAGAIAPIRDRLKNGARAGAEQIRVNPFAAIIGTAAVSAGVALLIPSGRRETEMMGEVANRISDAAREVADNAVEAGRQQVEALAQTALASGVGAVMQAVVSEHGEDEELRS